MCNLRMQIPVLRYVYYFLVEAGLMASSYEKKSRVATGATHLGTGFLLGTSEEVKASIWENYKIC